MHEKVKVKGVHKCHTQLLNQRTVAYQAAPAHGFSSKINGVVSTFLKFGPQMTLFSGGPQHGDKLLP